MDKMMVFINDSQYTTVFCKIFADIMDSIKANARFGIETGNKKCHTCMNSDAQSQHVCQSVVCVPVTKLMRHYGANCSKNRNTG